MYKSALALFLVAIVTAALADPFSFEDEDDELSRSLDMWIEEDRREVLDGFLERLYDTRQIEDGYKRAQMAFKSCEELGLMTNDCSGKGQCVKLAKNWFRCQCNRKYYGPKCDRKM